MKKILTFGYGNRTNYNSLKLYLEEHKVSYLIDVRRTPRAWTRMWYAQNVERFCNAQGIQYLSMPALGNISGKKAWIPPDADAAKIAISEVSQLAECETILLLCAEKDYQRCHRTEVADSICKLTKSQVHHLQ